MKAFVGRTLSNDGAENSALLDLKNEFDWNFIVDSNPTLYIIKRHYLFKQSLCILMGWKTGFEPATLRTTTDTLTS